MTTVKGLDGCTWGVKIRRQIARRSRRLRDRRRRWERQRSDRVGCWAYWFPTSEPRGVIRGRRAHHIAKIYGIPFWAPGRSRWFCIYRLCCSEWAWAN